MKKGKQFVPNVGQLYLKPDEAKVMILALGDFLGALKDTKDYKWNAETLKHREEMATAANSLRVKLEKITGLKCELPPYEEGDENEFLEE